MITCFIGTQKIECLFVYLIFLIIIIITLYQIIKVLYIDDIFSYDKKLKNIYKNNSCYIVFYFILNFPLIYTGIISFFITGQIYENDKFTKFSFISTLFTCSNPLIISLFRIIIDFNRINCVHKYLKKKRLIKKFQGSNYTVFMKELSASLTADDPFEWLEKHRLKFLMRDIFIGISHCLSKKLNIDNTKELNKEEALKYNEYIINDNYNIGDESIQNNSLIDIEITEYAPEAFYCMRNLEKISNQEMKESFLPEKNLKGIKKSSGKSGSFFISTDDNKYMIKTLKRDEFELIRLTFLIKYINYLKKNPDSLICRIYGMYKIDLQHGNDILIIVMKNLIGDLKENIICQYDLKGSTFNRKSHFDPQIVDKNVMKDLNFDEFETGLLFSENNSKTIREIVKKDSEFLASLDLMDYSLFVVKLSLNKEIEKEYFGNDIEEIRNKEYNKLISKSDDEIEIENDSNNNLLINDYKDIKIKLNYDKKNINYIFPSLQVGVGYIISIIDYFQYYNFFKLVETNVKRFRLIGKDKNSLSCVDPNTYSQRFINFVNKITNTKSFISQSKHSFEIEKDN
jgi:1-phosphatidylinositol-4-phosphate 5-kinase